MKLVASELQLSRVSKIRIEKVKSDNTVIAFHTGTYREYKEFVSASKVLGCTEKQIQDVVDRYNRQEKPYSIDLTKPSALPDRFIVRKERSDKQSGKVCSNIHECLNDKDAFIEWQHIDNVCVLDLDFSEHKPTANQLINYASTISPIPTYFWLSKNGGLHMLYIANDMFLASELASVAGYQLLKRFPNGSIEFLHRTRTPNKAKVYKSAQTYDISHLKSMLLEYVESDCKSWLEENNFVVGQRYPHTQCPVSPSERAKSNTNPVVIYDDHVFCYICQRDGKCMGSRSPGRFPIAALQGNKVHTMISKAVKNHVHFGHAKYILQIPGTEQHKRLLYSCLLKLCHGDDIRNAMAFTCAEPNGLVRYAGYWCDGAGKPIALAKNSNILKSLPHVYKLLPTGLIEADSSIIEWLSLPIDQSTRGYVPLTPIRGLHISQYQALPDNKIYTVLNSHKLSHESYESKRPVFLPINQRMPIDDAWNVLDNIFPNFDRNVVELLIVGRGCIEHRSGLPPMLFLSGPTSTGKTGHIQIASAICGDDAAIVHLNRDRNRFMNALVEAKSNAGFVVFDEIFKYAKQAQLDDVSAMEQLLSFNESTMIYALYIGNVPLGNLPFFLWCDNQIPYSVQSHEQIGRRIVHHHFSSTISWIPSMKQHSIGEPHLLRVNGDKDIIYACNSILSYVIEKHFTTPVTDFHETARSLGFKLLRETGAIDDKNALIAELFETLCNQPDITNAVEKKRWSKPGFKIATDNGVCNLHNAYKLLQTRDEYDTPKCKVIEECDLKVALKLSYPCRLEILKHGAKYAMRFVSTDLQYVNEGLKS